MKLWRLVLILVLIFTLSSCKKEEAYNSKNESAIAGETDYISDDKKTVGLADSCLEFWNNIEDFKVQKDAVMSFENNARDTVISEVISQNSQGVYLKSASITQGEETESYVKYYDSDGLYIKLNSEEPVTDASNRKSPEFKNDIEEIQTFLNEVKNAPDKFDYNENKDIITLSTVSGQAGNLADIEGLNEEIEVIELEIRYSFDKSSFSPKVYELSLVYKNNAEPDPINLSRKIIFEGVNTGRDIEKP